MVLRTVVWMVLTVVLTILPFMVLAVWSLQGDPPRTTKLLPGYPGFYQAHSGFTGDLVAVLLMMAITLVALFAITAVVGTALYFIFGKPPLVLP